MGAESSQPVAGQDASRKFQQSKSLDFSLGIPNSDQSSSSEVSTPASVQDKAGFSDFTLYPDRFSNPFKQKPASYGPSSLQPQHLNVGNNPLSLGDHTADISRYSFRVRSLSNRDQKSSNPDKTLEPSGGRQRSNSLSASFYYFDFSFIPEKDPRCARDEANKRIRVRNSSQCEDDDFHDIELNPQKKVAKVNRIEGNRKVLSPPQFSFFDFSMIPDKMDKPSKAVNITK